jgi:hypothetical protein
LVRFLDQFLAPWKSMFCWPVCTLSGRSGCPLGTNLVQSWLGLASVWGQSVTNMGHYRASVGQSGASMYQSRVSVGQSGASGCQSRASADQSRASVRQSGASVGQFGRAWDILGPVWGECGPVTASLLNELASIRRLRTSLLSELASIERLRAKLLNHLASTRRLRANILSQLASIRRPRASARENTQENLRQVPSLNRARKKTRICRRAHGIMCAGDHWVGSTPACAGRTGGVRARSAQTGFRYLRRPPPIKIGFRQVGGFSPGMTLRPL